MTVSPLLLPAGFSNVLGDLQERLNLRSRSQNQVSPGDRLRVMPVLEHGAQQEQMAEGPARKDTGPQGPPSTGTL